MAFYEDDDYDNLHYHDGVTPDKKQELYNLVNLDEYWDDPDLLDDDPDLEALDEWED